jgi:hypothetical protein
MAKAVVTKIEPFRLKKISQNDTFSARINGVKNFSVKIEQALPFRIKLTSIGIEGYGPNNPAPIGIAVIGLNNYIL